MKTLHEPHMLNVPDSSVQITSGNPASWTITSGLDIILCPENEFWWCWSLELWDEMGGQKIENFLRVEPTWHNFVSAHILQIFLIILKPILHKALSNTQDR